MCHLFFFSFFLNIFLKFTTSSKYSSRKSTRIFTFDDSFQIFESHSIMRYGMKKGIIFLVSCLKRKEKKRRGECGRECSSLKIIYNVFFSHFVFLFSLFLHVLIPRCWLALSNFDRIYISCPLLSFLPLFIAKNVIKNSFEMNYCPCS